MSERSDATPRIVVGVDGSEPSKVLGSVSAACSEHAHCPVLIVHAKTG